MRPTLFVLILSVLTLLTAIGQKPTVYYNVTKLAGSSDYYIGYRTKVTVTNSKKKGIDTTYFTAFHGLYAMSDKEALTPLLKIDSKDDLFLIDKEQYLVVNSNNKKGLLHLESGKLIIPFIYNYIYYVGEDDVFICKSKTEGNLHNRKGEKINTVFYKDLKGCYIGYYDGNQTGTNAKIYNAKNEVVADFGAAEIIEEMYYENNYLLYKNGKYGIVNAKNEILLPFNYTNIELTESEIGEFYEATQFKNNMELKTIIKPQEDGIWKEILPLDFVYITEIETYNSSSKPTQHPILEAVFYGINAQNKGVFMDKTGKTLLTLEDGPKIYQAAILEEKFLEVYINYSDYSVVYALENGKLLLKEGHYFQNRLPTPFDNFLLFTTEGKGYKSCFLNTVNYSVTTFNDYLYEFNAMKPELQYIYAFGEWSTHLIKFDLEKNCVTKHYPFKEFAEQDLIWWDQYNWLVAQEDYSKKGSLFVYDLVNDSLIYSGPQTEKAYMLAINSLSNQMNEELKNSTPLTNSLVNLPHLTTVKNSETTFSVSYYDDDINFILIPYLSKKMDFEWMDFSNAYSIGSTLTLNSNMLGVSFSSTTLLDDKLNVIMPFKEGYVVNIIPTPTGEIIALQHNEDSVNYFNSATGKTLYFNTIYKSIQVKPVTFYFFDWIAFANHVIIYEKDYNYIMDYNGKVLYKAKEINYENVGNNYIIEYADGGTELALLPSLVTAQVGEGLVQEYGVYPYVFVKNGQEYYGLYDAQTGKTVLNHEVKSFATTPYNESIWIQNKEGKFAIYNLKTNSIGNGYIFESEEAALLAMYGE